jgi:pimeloyl-ACP methyl ester carboxylesterase
MFGMLRYDATATLKTIRIPTLVVAANRDPVCKPDASERIGQDVPTATLTSLAPAKHMGFREHHTEFAVLVRDFARSCLHTAPFSEKTIDKTVEARELR